jgi:hypothetical protein
MKKGKVFFHPIDGSGSLTISWSSEPKGDAVEAKKGSGVGFFSEKKDLLCVIFDEVKSNNDHQVLEFDRYRIEIALKNGQVEYTLTQRNSNQRVRKRMSGRKQTI